ncbi:MAG: aminodeoxychorismate/anthranilate synthase component II [Coriobacteriaceae bacterium]|nr:aminodeoxychorismate/anthranilate synthase component II [Coriobacteriaceae bacterium]
MIVLIDNYDSFSYNLYQLIGGLGASVRVVRNDELGVEEIASLGPAGIVLSPGPGRPAEAGVCEELVRAFSGRVPILGVCLGHQAICEALGGKVVHAAELMHGKSSRSRVDTSSPLFRGIPEVISVARYHSLEVDEGTLPACLRPISRIEGAASGGIMAVGHVAHPTYGVQFHPESILTPEGPRIAGNFLGICRSHGATGFNQKGCLS